MHCLHCFSYPISPIATTDLNMLTLFCGGCINKFVVMQARYSPLCSFHLLHLDPRRFCPLHTLVNEDASQMVRNLIYIPDQGSYISNQGSGLKKLGILSSPNSTRLDHQARFFFNPSPARYVIRLGLNPIFMYNFQVGPVFFGLWVRKFDLYPTYCLLPIENFYPNRVNILVGMAFYGQVRFIMLDSP